MKGLAVAPPAIMFIMGVSTSCREQGKRGREGGWGGGREERRASVHDKNQEIQQGVENM